MNRTVSPITVEVIRGSFETADVENLLVELAEAGRTRMRSVSRSHG